VGADERNVVRGVHRILAAKRRQALEDAVADRRVARDGVDDDVEEPVGGLARVADDERAGMDALPKTCALLVQLCVSHEGDLDDGTRNVALARADQVRVACGPRRHGQQSEVDEPEHGVPASLSGSVLCSKTRVESRHLYYVPPRRVPLTCADRSQGCR
jgi:hypothetical protein